MNLLARQVRANLVEVKLGVGGQVSVFNAKSSVDLVVDVAGWVGPATASDPGGELRSLQPQRVLDSRVGVGVPKGPIAASTVVQLQVTGRGGVPAQGVSAVVLNVTGTQPTASAFVTAWPQGRERPTASNLNLLARTTVSNRVIVKVGSTGKVSLFHSAGSMHLVADVSGYFTSTSGVDTVGASFTDVVPFRAVDTRIGLGAAKQKLGPGQAITVQVSGSHGLPGFRDQRPPTAVVANVTGVGPTADTYLTVWPGGQPRPNTSDANLVPRETVPALVIAKLGPNGSVSIFNSSGTTDVLVDVLGYYSGDVALVAGALVLTAAETAAISGVTPSSVRFSTRTGAVAGIGVGSVISSGIGKNVPNGLLRRATAVRADGAGLIVETVDAALTDVVAFGALTETRQATRSAATQAGVIPEAAGSGPLADVGGAISESLAHTFVDQGGASVRSSGTFTASAGVEVDVDIGWTGLKRASMIAHADEALDAQLDIDYQGAWNGSVPLGSVTFAPITYTLGPVFIEVRPTLSATLTASGSAKGHADASVSQGEAIRVGVEYDGGDLGRVFEHTHRPTTHAGPHVSADVEAKVAVEVALKAAFYGGIANLTVGLSPYVRLAATECFARLYTGVAGSYVADISVLGVDKQTSGDATLAEAQLADIDLFGPCWKGTITVMSSRTLTDDRSGVVVLTESQTLTATIIAPTDNFRSDFSYATNSTADYRAHWNYPGTPCSYTHDYTASAAGRSTLTLYTDGTIGYGVVNIFDYQVPSVDGVSGGCDPVTFPAVSLAPEVCTGAPAQYSDNTVSPTLIEGASQVDDHFDTGSVTSDCRITTQWKFTRSAGG